MTQSESDAALTRIERALDRIERAAGAKPDTDRAALVESNARLKDGLRAAIADIDRLLATEPEKVG